MSALIIQADAKGLPIETGSVDLIVTSPPYFGLRAYTDKGEEYAGQIGIEATPKEYIDALIDATREWMRVLKPTGSMFVNLGDKYGRGSRTTISGSNSKQRAGHNDRCVPTGSPKSLLQLPQRYALRCVDELGLTLRADIIWRKTNPVPDPAKDRVGRGHEHIYHLTPDVDYYHRYVPGEMAVWDMQTSSVRVPAHVGSRHNAAFPTDLPRRIINRWCPPEGVVLDPFGGTGTTAVVADVMGRTGISVDASADYCRIAHWRVNDPKERAKVLR